MSPLADQPALQQTSTEVELAFLPLLVIHTRQGFYADPIYGGNRDHVGWKTIGFPGPASLADVHSGRYTTLPYFADGEAERLKEFHDGL
jgi:gluconate 2-dehydrogenase gamma chain